MLPYRVYENTMLVASFLARGDADNYIDMRCENLKRGIDLRLMFGENRIGGFTPDGEPYKG